MTETLRVLLADDEPLALERLLFAFRDIDGTEVVGTAANGLEAAAKISELKPDIAVLDIQMPGRSGVGVAAGLDPADRPDIIFVTAYDQHAVDAFDVEAADYVLKPLRSDRLRQAIERVRRRRGRREVVQIVAAEPAPADGDQAFWVQTGRGLIRVGLEDVEWIEAARDYVLLHTTARSHILRATMGGIETHFPPPALLRVHRSAFVRPGAVRALQTSPSGGAVLLLAHGVAVPVGTTYLPGVTKRFR
jgi:DNA-binding LytR/AlgR family response regulator